MTAPPGDRACTIVVPCYDEARRLDVAALVELSAAAGATILAVDDGSTDDTADLLAAAARDHDCIRVLALSRNGGKGEAVRAGLASAIADGAAVVGYFDADLATPVDEMARLVATLTTDDHIDVVLGSRINLLGHDIERSAWRHYLGRLFATMSSAALRLAVYDTQCGAKVLRVTPALHTAIARPFRSRWSFDVELLGRLLAAGADPSAFVEVPLRTWRDVGGSKLRPTAALGAGLAVARLLWNRPPAPP